MRQGTYHAWLTGFLSGYNVYAAGGDVTGVVDLRGLTSWIDNYCAANPLDTISLAADRLIIELRSRRRR